MTLSISLFITHYWLFKSKSQYFWIVRVHPRESSRKRRPQRPRENGNFQLRKRVSTGTQISDTFFSSHWKKTYIYVYILPSLSSAKLLNLFGEVSPKSSSIFYAVCKLWKIRVCFRIIFNVQPRCWFCSFVEFSLPFWSLSFLLLLSFFEKNIFTKEIKKHHKTLLIT